jgi:anaerobic selenocysteine-containing dehydrogenase
LADHRYPSSELYGKYEKFFSLLPTKKAEVYSTVLEQLGYDPLPTYREPGETPISRPDLAEDYPLICTAALKPGLYTHSQYRSLPWLKEIMPGPWIEIHSEKADQLCIKDGEMVVVESPRGSIEIRCKVLDTLNPEVVGITHGWGSPCATSDPITNILTPDNINCPISDSPSSRCFLVKVRAKEQEVSH